MPSRLVTRCLAIAAVVLVFAARVDAATIQIDDFSFPAVGSKLQADVAGGDAFREVGPSPSILGMFRDEKISDLAGAGGGTAEIAPNANGSISLSLPAMVEGIFTLTYDGEGTLPPDGTGPDYLGGLFFGEGVFVLTGTTDPNTPVVVALTVEDVNGDTSTFSQTVPVVGGNFTLQFPTALLSGTADLTAVDSIQLRFENPEAADITLDNFAFQQEIPEPTSIVVMSTTLAGMGLAAVIRKRRKALAR